MDMLEAAHTQLVQRLDTAAIIFGLKTKGRLRGWSEKEIPSTEAQSASPNHVDAVVAAIETRAKLKGVAVREELENYLRIFGERLEPKICKELHKRFGPS